MSAKNRKLKHAKKQALQQFNVSDGEFDSIQAIRYLVKDGENDEWHAAGLLRQIRKIIKIPTKKWTQNQLDVMQEEAGNF